MTQQIEKKVNKEIERRDTPKKKKLIRLISENLGIEGFTKTMYSMMIEAGYSETSAKQQSAILAGIKEELEPITNELETIRNKAINRLKQSKLTDKAGYKDLIDGIDKLTKNIQLIKGKSTENIAGVLLIKPSPEEIERANKLIMEIE